MSKLFLSLLVLLSVSAHATLKRTEGSVPGAPGLLRYVMMEDTTSTNPDVIYWLHGYGGNENETQSVYEALAEEWVKTGTPAPRMIGISFGPKWLLVNKTSLPASGLLDYVLQSGMPYLESQVLKALVGARSLIGYSMGGFNALQTGTDCSLKFDRVAMISAGLVMVSPFASEQEIEALAVQYWPDLPREEAIEGAKGLFPWALSVVSNQEEFDKLDPRKRATNLIQVCEKAPSFYISVGLEDIWFVPGNKELAGIIRNTGTQVELHELAGGHDAFDYAGLAKFITAAH